MSGFWNKEEASWERLDHHIGEREWSLESGDGDWATPFRKYLFLDCGLSRWRRWFSFIQNSRSPEWRATLKYTINDAFTVIVLPGVLLLAALVVLFLCIYALVKRRRDEKYPTIRKTENDLCYRAGKDRQLPDCNFVTDANIGCGQYSPFQENCYGNPVWKFSPNCLHAISQKNCLHWIRVDTKSNNRKIFYCLLDCTLYRSTLLAIGVSENQRIDSCQRQ